MFNQKIQDAWNFRCGKVVEGSKLCAEGDKFRAEGDKIYAEGNKLVAEGINHFYNTVIQEIGNVEISWNESNPIVDGWEYKENGHRSDSCEGKVVEIEGKKYKLTEVK